LNQSLHGKKSAMNSLLELMCDVVVEVDSDLKIAEESPRLAAMLTPGSRSAVKNTCLEKFMPFDEDKDKYKSQLRVEGGLNAGVLHVKMRDSMSNLISVDLYYVQCSHNEDKKHFLIGLRESADIQIAAMKGSSKPRKKKPAEAQSSSSGSSPRIQNQESTMHHDAEGIRAPIQIGAKDCSEDASCGTRNISLGLSGTQSWASGKMSEFIPRQLPLQGGLLRRDLNATQDAGFTLSLISAMSRWNFKIPKESCCPVHAAIEALQDYAAVLKSYPCSQEFGPKGSTQCQRCGLVYGADWRGRSEQVTRCYACDSETQIPCASAIQL